MDLTPVTLEGRHVRLEPLRLAHIPALNEAAKDPRIWEFTSAVARNPLEMQQYVDTALDWQQAGTAMPFVTMTKDKREVIGSTRFANIDATNRRAEIGWTWINPTWWRTAVNTEAKYLMLQHAFEHWNCVRVELKTGTRNERSRDAIRRLGAKEEGILRRHILQPDGSWRDTVYFSILEDEWPSVKRELERRLSSNSP
jgi:RimJ/RimL family protein N-acetyltransferase